MFNLEDHDPCLKHDLENRVVMIRMVRPEKAFRSCSQSSATGGTDWGTFSVDIVVSLRKSLSLSLSLYFRPTICPVFVWENWKRITTHIIVVLVGWESQTWVSHVQMSQSDHTMHCCRWPFCEVATSHVILISRFSFSHVIKKIENRKGNTIYYINTLSTINARLVRWMEEGWWVAGQGVDEPKIGLGPLSELVAEAWVHLSPIKKQKLQ